MDLLILSLMERKAFSWEKIVDNFSTLSKGNNDEIHSSFNAIVTVYGHPALLQKIEKYPINPYFRILPNGQLVSVRKFFSQ